MAALKLSISSTFRSGLMYVANSRSVTLVSGGFLSGIDLSSDTGFLRLHRATSDGWGIFSQGSKTVLCGVGFGQRVSQQCINRSPLLTAKLTKASVVSVNL